MDKVQASNLRHFVDKVQASLRLFSGNHEAVSKRPAPQAIILFQAVISGSHLIEGHFSLKASFKIGPCKTMFLLLNCSVKIWHQIGLGGSTSQERGVFVFLLIFFSKHFKKHQIRTKPGGRFLTGGVVASRIKTKIKSRLAGHFRAKFLKGRAVLLGSVVGSSAYTSGFFERSNDNSPLHLKDGELAHGN